MIDPRSQLEYAPPVPLHQRRLIVKWLTGFVLLLSAVLGLRLVPVYFRRAELIYFQSQCMAFLPDPNQSVATYLPALAGFSPHTLPGCWVSFYTLYSPPGLSSRGTAFLHERKRPDGQSRLVAVDMEHMIGGFGPFEWSTRVVLPGTLFHPPQQIPRLALNNFEPIVDGNAEIYPDAIDSTDPSHLSFRVRTTKHTYRVDEWLRDDDRCDVRTQLLSDAAERKP